MVGRAASTGLSINNKQIELPLEHWPFEAPRNSDQAFTFVAPPLRDDHRKLRAARTPCKILMRAVTALFPG